MPEGWWRTVVAEQLERERRVELAERATRVLDRAGR